MTSLARFRALSRAKKNGQEHFIVVQGERFAVSLTWLGERLTARQGEADPVSALLRLTAAFGGLVASGANTEILSGCVQVFFRVSTDGGGEPLRYRFLHGLQSHFKKNTETADGAVEEEDVDIGELTTGAILELFQRVLPVASEALTSETIADVYVVLRMMLIGAMPDLTMDDVRAAVPPHKLPGVMMQCASLWLDGDRAYRAPAEATGEGDGEPGNSLAPSSGTD